MGKQFTILLKKLWQFADIKLNGSYIMYECNIKKY